MKIIQEVTTAYSQAATETMKANINDLKEDLEHKLEKTSLPRPQALGKKQGASMAAEDAEYVQSGL